METSGSHQQQHRKSSRESSSSSGGEDQEEVFFLQQRYRQPPEGREKEFNSQRRVGRVQVMGAGDERFYHPAAGLRCAPNQLGQSRDFHYTLQQQQQQQSDQNYGRTSQQGRHNRQQQQQQPPPPDGYHSPHATVISGTGTTSRARSGARDNGTFYLDNVGAKGSSPYHHPRRSTVRSGHSSRDQHENYLLLREAQRQQAAAAVAAAAQAEYLQHHSNSRQDLLDHDHNSIYDIAYQSPAQNPQTTQYGFVRTCDGKFVRTAIPIQDFESLLESSSGANGSASGSQRDYYRSSVNHTIRRPSKRQHQASSATSGQCCPSRESESTSQSYATLRGRKQRGENSGQSLHVVQGIGDNYGRNQHHHLHHQHQFSYPTLDDARSMASFASAAEEYLPIQPPPPQCVSNNSHDAAAAALNSLAAAAAAAAAATDHHGHQHHRRTSRLMSRSTDRNLDSMGLSDEELMVNNGNNSLFLQPIRNSTDEVLSLLPREPPDGNEKPDQPSKNNSMHKLEMLARKNSKCDLLDTASMQTQSMGGSNPTSGVDSRSDLGDGPKSSNSSTNLESLVKRDSISCKEDSANLETSGPPTSQMGLSDSELDSGLGSSIMTGKDWKSIPSSPHIGASVQPLANPSPKAILRPGGGNMGPMGSSSMRSAVITNTASNSSSAGPGSSNTSSSFHHPQHHPQLAVVPHNHHAGFNNAANHQSNQSKAILIISWADAIKRYVTVGTTQFFGVDPETELAKRNVWADRRKRLAIKKFGGIKDFLYTMENNAYNNQYAENYSRLRYDQHLTSELEGDKMVLKIARPPRNKDSLTSLTIQGIGWMIKSFTTKKIPKHQIMIEHEMSRSYQPSVSGIAAYYQAEQTGGLAMCPPPLPRANSSHLLHGENLAEEIFFDKPSCDGDDLGGGIHSGKRIAYSSEQYRPYNWQRSDVPVSGTVAPAPPVRQTARITLAPGTTASGALANPLQHERDHVPRMSSDVGASRIWNRLLDAAFDNSDRRKHGMGVLTRMMSSNRTRRRLQRLSKGNASSGASSTHSGIGGNASDHRPFFTYWITFVQIIITIMSIASYGLGPIGVDLYKRAGMVLVTNLELEPVGHFEPANFWIGPSAISLIHLGAKYAPCMRWDSALDRSIVEDRHKERDTACCIRKDRAGCVQSPKTECSKIGDNDPSASGSSPRSHWWQPSEWYSKYPHENRRSSGPVCGLDPAYCEAPASVAPYIWPDDITKWPICRRKTDIGDLVDSASGQTAEHMICEIIGHPCCIGIRGQCKITTKEYCLFVGGTFHEEAALCSQVSCLDDVCGLLPFRARDVPDQFYRTWTPIFLHAGVIHLAITVLFQYWLMRDLEKLVGSARVAIIYLGSGMVGNLASAIILPYRADVGPGGAHFGLLALCLVEIIHQWHTLSYPEMAVVKIIGVMCVLFLLGFLPWIDNYAHIFGFLFGLLISYAILPFVTMGGNHQHHQHQHHHHQDTSANHDFERRRKVIVIWICLVSVSILFLGLLLLFYLSPIQDCEICQYLSCIPITKDFCADQNIQLTHYGSMVID